MPTISKFPQEFDGTDTAVNRWVGAALLWRQIANQATRGGHVSTAKTVFESTFGQKLDPEEAVLRQLRIADQRKRRSQAHARITLKRIANPVGDLLALLDRPEYKIQVSDELLQEIFNSYPEDD